MRPSIDVPKLTSE